MVRSGTGSRQPCPQNACATTLGTGVDDAVRRIATTYEVRGMKASITSYDNPTVGTGNVLNQCQFVYNDFGQLVTEYQAHDGAVNVSTTPQVGYTYADGSANTIRPTGLVYPNGRVISYAYGDTDSIDDRASRISAILDDDESMLAGYAMLGRSTFVAQTSPEPQMKWTLVDLDHENDPDTGDIYSGLDRFGRVKDNRWYNDDAEEDVDRIQYGYDRAGNRIWRKNVVAESLGKKFDELYDYDAIHRLKDLDRGTLTALKDAINDPQFAECWSLDATGNWAGYKQSDDGTGWSLEQSRAANEVNEITNISETTGPSWVTPVYSPAGNMTTMPQPKDPTKSYTATYDAWNRLVKITDGEDTVGQYAYDGAKRRIVQENYTSGVLSETRHLYYTEPSKWQVVEERIGTSSDAERQFVWGLRYIDDLIVRDRDTDTNGTLDERLYACQDANWNVTAIIDDSGNVQERYATSAYGIPEFMNATFEPQSAENCWQTMYCGYHYDSTSGLYLVRYRSLHPVSGMWLQRDPAQYLDSANLYVYCTCTPIVKTDPYGLAANILYAGGVGCAVSAGWSTLASIASGHTFNQGACRAGVSCILGGLGVGLAALFPQNPRLGACLIGGIQGIASAFAGRLCDPPPRCGPERQLGCAILSATITAAFACVVGSFLDAQQVQNAERFLTMQVLSLTSRIVGSDLNAICTGPN